jgi:PHB de-polymerase C-terminus
MSKGDKLEMGRRGFLGLAGHGSKALIAAVVLRASPGILAGSAILGARAARGQAREELRQPTETASGRARTLCAYLARRFGEGGEITMKLLFDDDADPIQFPFLDLYTSNLDAKFFLDNTKAVFQDCLFREGALRFRGERVHPKAIGRTALLTIEGELDDIAAPGQTSAAHSLCTSLPEQLRRRAIVPGSGHFSLFYGNTWRREVLPVILNFCGCAS